MSLNQPCFSSIIKLFELKQEYETRVVKELDICDCYYPAGGGNEQV